MGAKDTETKAYLSDAARFADAFNFMMYDGREVIQPGNLRALDTTATVLPYGSEGKEPLQKIRDVLKLYSAMEDDNAIYLILGLEAQSAVHFAMPVRNMLYDAMGYTEQVAKIAAAHRKEGRKMTPGEYLSGFCKDDRLIPVITLVLLFSPNPWDGPVSLHEMLQTKDEAILAFVPDYKLHLIAPAAITDNDFDKFRTGLGAVMQFIKHQNDESMDWLQCQEKFAQVDFESASLIKTITGTDIQLEDEKGASVNMCKAWENSLQKARIEAAAEGKAEGRAEGRAEGIAEGAAKGTAKGHNDMLQALKMLKDNVPLEEISRLTGCSMESISELKALAFAN